LSFVPRTQERDRTARLFGAIRTADASTRCGPAVIGGPFEVISQFLSVDFRLIVGHSGLQCP
jgi:hypothetical protein